MEKMQAENIAELITMVMYCEATESLVPEKKFQ
jgi:hypothetical protein